MNKIQFTEEQIEVIDSIKKESFITGLTWGIVYTVITIVIIMTSLFIVSKVFEYL
jgi:hypothetical protein